MITETEKREIIRSGEFKEAQFTIAATANVFQILRDKIYTNKPLAVLRETVANTKDANVEAGKSHIPVDIIFPTHLEPTLKVRDCGNSMSHETVMKLYSTYGLSTKNKSNDYIGSFGIGKMAAFGYTSSFQLTCVQDNYKRIYNMYLDEDSIGKIALLSEGEVENESTGTEVAVPIKVEDINTFIATAKELFRFWEPRPNIKCADIGFEDSKYIVKGNGWAFLEDDYYWNTTYILMGGVPYKINASSIPNINQTERYILGKSLVLFSNIGDITVDAGRENVEFTDKSIKWIKNKLEQIIAEAKKELDDKTQNINSEFSAKQVFYDFFSHSGKYASFLSNILKTSGVNHIKYNNIPITDYTFILNNKNSAGINILHYSTREKYIRGRGEYRYSTSSTYISKMDVFAILYQEEEQNPKVQRFYYYLQDATKTEEAEMYFLRKQARHLLISEEDGKQEKIRDSIYIAMIKDKQDLDNYIAKVGYPADFFTDISSVVIPPKPKKPRKPRTTNIVRKSPCEKYDHVNQCFVPYSIDVKAVTGHYIIRRYSDYYLEYDAINEKGVKFDYNYKEFIKEKGVTTDIYAFNPHTVKKIAKTTWKPFKDHLKEILEAHNKTLDFSKIPVSELNVDDSQRKFFKMICTGQFKLNKDHKISSIISKIDFEEKIVNRVFEYMNNHFGLKVGTYDTTKNKEYEKLINAEYKKYPLIDHHYFFNDSSYDDEFLVYLNGKYNQLSKKKELEKAAAKV